MENQTLRKPIPGLPNREFICCDPGTKSANREITGIWRQALGVVIFGPSGSPNIEHAPRSRAKYRLVILPNELGAAEAAIARVDDEGRVKRRASPVTRLLNVKNRPGKGSGPDDTAVDPRARRRRNRMTSVSGAQLFPFPPFQALTTCRGATAEASGLAGSGPRFIGITRQLVKILRGAKPADIPVLGREQSSRSADRQSYASSSGEPAKFELVINLRTAKAIRL